MEKKTVVVVVESSSPPPPSTSAAEGLLQLRGGEEEEPAASSSPPAAKASSSKGKKSSKAKDASSSSSDVAGCLGDGIELPFLAVTMTPAEVKVAKNRFKSLKNELKLALKDLNECRQKHKELQERMVRQSREARERPMREALAFSNDVTDSSAFRAAGEAIPLAGVVADPPTQEELDMAVHEARMIQAAFERAGLKLPVLDLVPTGAKQAEGEETKKPFLTEEDKDDPVRKVAKDVTRQVVQKTIELSRAKLSMSRMEKELKFVKERLVRELQTNAELLTPSSSDEAAWINDLRSRGDDQWMQALQDDINIALHGTGIRLETGSSALSWVDKKLAESLFENAVKIASGGGGKPKRGDGARG
jgi:hypothetical protein